MRGKLPKILVFTPTYKGKDYCADDFIQTCLKLTYKNRKHIIVDNTNDGGAYAEELRQRYGHLGFEIYHIERGASTREALARAQNLGRKIVLEEGYDYMFSLESDVFPLSNVIDVLLLANQDICAATYAIGNREDNTRTLCITVDDYKEKTNTWGTRLLTPKESNEWVNTGLRVVAAAGMGACLIHKGVLEKIAFTFVPGHSGHSDVFFMNTARRKGFHVVVNTDVFCKHVNQDWATIEDR